MNREPISEEEKRKYYKEFEKLLMKKAEPDTKYQKINNRIPKNRAERRKIEKIRKRRR